MLRHLASLLLFLLLVACSGCQTDLTTGQPLDEADTDPAITVDEPAPATAPALATTALELVNAQRATGCRCGSETLPAVPPLRLNDQLATAARLHSADQAAQNRMQHRGSDGSQVGTRVTRAGYAWRSVGENVAWNYPTVEAVIGGWFASEGHCRNLMNARFTDMGIAEDNRYWTQVFAAQ